jgi:hypothetical protein
LIQQVHHPSENSLKKSEEGNRGRNPRRKRPYPFGQCWKYAKYKVDTVNVERYLRIILANSSQVKRGLVSIPFPSLLSAKEKVTKKANLFFAN